MKLILDKSFLQAEPQDCRRLSALAEAGFQFVCIDTLGYEFCSGLRSSDWIVAQRKLARFADQTEFWWHVSALMLSELSEAKPVSDPCDHNLTDYVRERWKRGIFESSNNFKAVIDASYGEREVDSVGALRQYYEEQKSKRSNALQALVRETGKGGSGAAEIRAALLGSEMVAQEVRQAHGNPEDPQLFIAESVLGMNREWVLYREHEAKMALVFVLMAKYGNSEIPEKEFTNTKLDLDYLGLLHFADALATNETSGLMSNLFSVIHGRSKMYISSAYIDRNIPSSDQIAEAAYFGWLGGGSRDGNDLGDWFEARRNLLHSYLATDQRPAAAPARGINNAARKSWPSSTSCGISIS